MFLKVEKQKKGNVVEFTSERDERVKILVNSGISEVDRIEMRVSSKSYAVRLQEC